MKRYFITGIGTDVGKTFCAAVLTEALKADYWKPVQTGNTDGSDSMVIKMLLTNDVSQIHREAYTFEKPVSPHLAANIENEEIQLDLVQAPETNNPFLIIEGAGGLLVPLNNKAYVKDLVSHLQAQTILVVREYLGCINHSLLSIDYLLRNNIPVKGLILNGNFNPLVEKSIVDYANLPILAKLPQMEGISKRTVYELAQGVNKEIFQ